MTTDTRYDFLIEYVKANETMNEWEKNLTYDELEERMNHMRSCGWRATKKATAQIQMT